MDNRNASLTEEQRWTEIDSLFKRSFCEDRDEVKEMILSYNDGVSEEARQILKDSIYVDGLCCAVVDYGWIIKASGVTAMNCTVPGTIDSTGRAIESIIQFYSTVEKEPIYRLVDSVQDILDCKRDGKIGAIIGAQSCDFINTEHIESTVKAFSNLGLRIMQIAYNDTGFAGDGCYSKLNIGLTSRGREMIRAMEKHRIIVDLSHVGVRTTMEAMEFCEKPMIFSHSNPYELFPHPRNLSLEQAKLCASRGGVIGAVCAYNATLWNGRDFPNAESYLRSIDYFVEHVGINHVAIGTDTIASAGAYAHEHYLAMCHLHRTLGKDVVAYRAHEAGLGYNVHIVEGMSGMANIVKVIDMLLKRGYTREDIDKLLGLNWLRVFRENWGN